VRPEITQVIQVGTIHEYTEMKLFQFFQKGLVGFLFAKVTSVQGIFGKFRPDQGIKTDSEQAAADKIYNFPGSFYFAGRQEWGLGKNSDGVFMTQNIMGDLQQ